MTITAKFFSLSALLLTALIPASGSAQTVNNGKVAFTDADTNGNAQVFTINPDGSGLSQITTLGENFFPSWSWDGSQIVYASRRTGTMEIWRMGSNGGNQVQLTFNTPGINLVPAWSPDGTKIVYASALDSVGFPEVWVMDSDGSDQQQLTFTPLIPGGITWSILPGWSPDGSRIVYASTVSGSSQIWIMNADGSGKTQMTNGNGPDFPDSNAPAWSRDGLSIAFWSGFETQFGEVWVMNADGTNKRKLTDTNDPLSSDNPTWAPDGSMLLFDTNREGPGIAGIWKMESSGLNPTLLTPFELGVSPGRSSWQALVGCCDTPGDYDNDGAFNIADVTAGIARIFSGGPAPSCQDQADADGDNTFNIADVTYGIARIFTSGPAPVCGTTGV